MTVCSLGVDTDLFHPVPNDTDDRTRIHAREEVGIARDEVVCVYIGRFSEDKDPLCLARAIDSLVSRGEPFRGLFVGTDPRTEAISPCVSVSRVDAALGAVT